MSLTSSMGPHTPLDSPAEAHSQHNFARFPTTSPSSSDFARRHTYLSPSSPRGGPRPLRSSPLAGPSVAVSEDGMLTGSDESDGGKPRCRPSKISSASDVHSILIRASSSKSEPGSRRPATSDGTSRHISLAVPAATQSSRRLSMGVTKLNALPSLPVEHSPQRTGLLAPPVPGVPTWAKLEQSDNISLRSASSRRPPSVASQSTSSLKRHSTHVTHSSPPSTSRDHQQNWLSSAPPPKFSRLSLRAEGVVLPVSAKEATAKRHSMILGAPSVVADKSHRAKGNNAGVDKPREEMPCTPARTPSRTSVSSYRSLASTADTIPAPNPPFSAPSRSVSWSSVASSLSRSPPATPSLSLSRTESVVSIPEVDELGVLPSDHSSGHTPPLPKASRKGDADEEPDVSSVEVRMNGVRVDVIEMRGSRERKVVTPGANVKKEHVAAETTPSQNDACTKPRKGRSIKRLWARVMGVVRR